MKSAGTFCVFSALASSAFAAIVPVTTQGNAFFAGTERFYIRGVDYQPGGSSDPIDPLANPVTCKRDIPYFKQLGINTIRVYTVDNTVNHDECMSALADAGIYLALDVNNGLYSLNRADPAPSYNNVYLGNVFATIDAFKNYNNTLLFFSGNEVINTPKNSNTAPYVKAVVRDMKNYILHQSPRLIPVGYSAADVAQNRFQTALYLNCGPDGMARSDFFAFNDYSYCDPSSYTISDYSTEVQMFNNYSIPLFFSEYGCNLNPPRPFHEVKAIYSKKMTKVFSGGLVYEWSEEVDNPHFGLVKIDSNTKVTPLIDYKNLMAEFKSTPNPTGTGGYHKNLPDSNCPPAGPNWDVHGVALPAIPVPAEQYILHGAPKGKGLSGPGSQHAGVDSTGFIVQHEAGVTETAAKNVPQPTSGSGSGNAGSNLRPAAGQLGPIVCAATVAGSILLGAVLL